MFYLERKVQESEEFFSDKSIVHTILLRILSLDGFYLFSSIKLYLIIFRLKAR